MEHTLSKIDNLKMNAYIRGDNYICDNITEDNINIFFNELNLTKDDMKDYTLNTKRNSGYVCDFCKEKCYGDVRQYTTKFINDKSTKFIIYRGPRDMCEKCYDKDTINNYPSIQMNATLYKTIICNKYEEDTSYDYTIMALKVFQDSNTNNTNLLYVIEEKNINDMYQDIHYYLKYYKNKKVVVDYELDTYNPYFGCDIISLNLNENIITVEYYEKHKTCKVSVMEDGNTHNVYLKSQPKTFARCQNTNVKSHNIGKVIKFLKNGKENKNLNYFNYDPNANSGDSLK